MSKKSKTVLKPFRSKRININGVWTTCNVPPTHEAYDYWYERLFKALDSKWRMLKLDWLISSYERQDARARKKYCRTGHHKVKPAYESIKRGKERTISVRYLKCVHCNYIFFSKMSDKKNYDKIQNQTKEGFSAFFKTASCPKPKDSSGMVQKKKKEPSVRGSKSKRKT